MKESIGLKGLSKNLKGRGIKWKVKEVYWQLRYAIQRAWRGYDAVDVCDLGFAFVERMPFLLREFKKHNNALFPNVNDNWEFPTEFTKEEQYSLTEEETDAILDEMIFYFENCDEDVVYKRLYGISPYEDNYNFDRWKAAEEERRRCWREAMRLFSKWSMYLWY